MGITSRIVSPANQQLVLQWLREHHTEYSTRVEALGAAFAAIMPPGERHPKLNSSTVHRYLSLAGLTKSSASIASTVEDNNPIKAIQRAEQQIRDALLEMDAERNRLMARVKELDNLVAKYSKVHIYSE